MKGTHTMARIAIKVIKQCNWQKDYPNPKKPGNLIKKKLKFRAEDMDEEISVAPECARDLVAAGKAELIDPADMDVLFPKAKRKEQDEAPAKPRDEEKAPEPKKPAKPK
jgi:hypothetical protein